MLREIRTTEKITDKFEEESKSKGYLRIKPETNITVEEANRIFERIIADFEKR